MKRRNKILLIILATFVSLIVFYLLDFKHLILMILFKKNLMISTKKLS